MTDLEFNYTINKVHCPHNPKHTWEHCEEAHDDHAWHLEFESGGE